MLAGKYLEVKENADVLSDCDKLQTMIKNDKIRQGLQIKIHGKSGKRLGVCDPGYTRWTSRFEQLKKQQELKFIWRIYHWMKIGKDISDQIKQLLMIYHIGGKVKKIFRVCEFSKRLLIVWKKISLSTLYYNFCEMRKFFHCDQTVRSAMDNYMLTKVMETFDNIYDPAIIISMFDARMIKYTGYVKSNDSELFFDAIKKAFEYSNEEMRTFRAEFYQFRMYGIYKQKHGQLSPTDPHEFIRSYWVHIIIVFTGRINPNAFNLASAAIVYTKISNVVLIVLNKYVGRTRVRRLVYIYNNHRMLKYFE